MKLLLLVFITQLSVMVVGFILLLEIWRIKKEILEKIEKFNANVGQLDDEIASIKAFYEEKE